MQVNVFNPFSKLFVKKQIIVWKQHRCPTCNALLYEVDEKSFSKSSVRIKCRLCKNIEVH